MDLEKNIYGLSEGVFKVCQFLGLKFPPEVPSELQSSQEHVPSDYFGDDFELTEAMKTKLRRTRKWTPKKFATTYKSFSDYFLKQKPLKHTKTDLNVYFCDHVLFASIQNGAAVVDYFDYEFYAKSFESRKEFATMIYARTFVKTFNEPWAIKLAKDKAETNKFFADFLHRDWIDVRKCSFEEFQLFVKKHPRFFSKPVRGMQGKGAEIINVESNDDLENIFTDLKGRGRLLEEILTQHEALAEFCPDTVNTIRVYTILDVHNVVHFLMAFGKFGRLGNVVDNFHGGGYCFIVDPKTGIVISDGINRSHERSSKHPDTGKTFKGFQYPYWNEVLVSIKKMAKRIPQLRHIGWDITIGKNGETILIEINSHSGMDAPQAADDTGRLHLYKPLLEEIRNYKREQMKLLGWRVNNLPNFRPAYDAGLPRKETRFPFAMSKLIPDCASLMDVGCRKDKFLKTITPPPIAYYPVDYEAHDDEVIACDFNEDFPDIKVDTCFCAFTAEFVEHLPQFLANMCNAAQKQILMWCRPIDRDQSPAYRWKNPFLTDYTEEFLIKTMYPAPEARSVILYDFRKIHDE